MSTPEIAYGKFIDENVKIVSKHFRVDRDLKHISVPEADYDDAVKSFEVQALIKAGFYLQTAIS